jgi:hypothetical protein
MGVDGAVEKSDREACDLSLVAALGEFGMFEMKLGSSLI